MKAYSPSVLDGTGYVIVGAVAVLMAIALPVRGQTHPTQPANITNDERIRQQDMSRREWELRNLANEPKENNNPQRTQAVVDQVQQDFKRILTLHNELARTLSAGNSLDYNFVSDASAEIKKRASRLQVNFGFSKPEGDERNQESRQDLNETQIRDRVTTLCKQIESFVRNPIIETPGTVDAQQLARARRDLAGVIETSGNLRKNADRLKKIGQ